MNAIDEKVTYSAKWLRYFMYVQIAALAITTIGNKWVHAVVDAATVYLMFRLAGANPRYKTAAIFYLVALGLLIVEGHSMDIICIFLSTLAQYQWYTANYEMLLYRDYRLANKWKRLFWAQFINSWAILVLLFAAFITSVSGSLVTGLIFLILLLASLALYFVLKILSLTYLNRTAKAWTTNLNTPIS